MISPLSVQDDHLREQRMAVFSAVCAYFLWGTFGLYFKALDEVSPLEILAHRIIWSVIFLALIITFMKKWAEIFAILCTPKKLGLYALSALLVSTNWGIYIYSVVSGQALEGSMGYFILPLVAVMFGAIFFGERFSKPQALAILLALSGVAYQVWSFGKLPWIALTLAFSFGLYGVLRKKAPADSINGLFLETLLMSPIALCFITYKAFEGDLFFLGAPIDMIGLLLLAGPITAIPLIMFAYGARKLRYSTVGLLQYINPTCQFFIAIFIFKEPFEITNLITFAFIWAGLLLYTQNTVMQTRQKKLENS